MNQNFFSRPIYWVALICILKFILVVALPVTGDEAYFIYLSKSIEGGAYYYDHPPFVIWLLSVLRSIFGDQIVPLRLFGLFSSFTVAYAIFKILLFFGIDYQKSLWTAYNFLVIPFGFFIILITNDLPLFLFSFLAILLFFLSLSHDRHWIIFSAIAGIFAGFAFLSKYLFVLVAFGFLAFLFLFYRDFKKNIFISFLVFFGFVIFNLYQNYNNCWSNIVFNFFTRTSEFALDPFGIWSLVFLLIYAFTPWGLYFILRQMRSFEGHLAWLIALVLGVGFFVLLLVALSRSIGLHWILIFLPYIALSFSFLKLQDLRRVFFMNLIFSIFQFLIAVFLILSLRLYPGSMLSDEKIAGLKVFDQPQEICNFIRKLNDPVFMRGYTMASVLSYHCDADYKTLFEVSKYGRTYDFVFDIRRLHQKTIAIFDKKPPSFIDPSQEICSSFDTSAVDIGGSKFYATICSGFDFDQYKQHYIIKQRDKFYNIPKWLPIGHCPFFEKYDL